MLRVLASGKAMPYGEDLLRHVARMRQRPAPSAQIVQGALRTLLRRGLLRPFEPRGAFHFADPGFADWISRRPAADFLGPDET